MSFRTVVATLAALCVVSLLAGCDTSPPNSAETTPTPTPTASALQRWDAAYAFLEAQTKPFEVACYKTEEVDGTWSMDPDVALIFFSLDSDREEWEPYLRYRDDPKRYEGGRECAVNVPSTVPYNETDIEAFLNPYGLTWYGREGLHRGEISYGGGPGNTPDSIYVNAPGLWGLRSALAFIDGDDVVDTETDVITLPTTDAEAQRYLDAAASLLDWYGYAA